MKKNRLNFKKLIIVLLVPCVIIIGYVVFKPTPKQNKTTNNANKDPVSTKVTTNKVSFVAVGDNIGHERIYTYADKNAGTLGDQKYDFTPSYKYMKDYISKADLAFVNQETILGGDDLGISGYPAFNTPTTLAKDLVATGFDLVNGASNHTLDKGFSGIQNSAKTWREYNNVIFNGAFDSQEDADTIRVIERNGIKFSLLSYTYGTNGYETPNKYAVPLFEREKITSDVAKAKALSDVVIVSAHWGVESNEEVTEMQRTYAQLFADLGVDVVIGTHPHVIQPMEWLTGVHNNKTLIAYSLGNFLSTMESVDTQLEGMLSMDFIKKDGKVAIENVTWTPLINHYDNSSVFCVMPLKDYTNELNAQHYILKDQQPNAINAFKQKTKEIIGDNFNIDD